MSRFLLDVSVLIPLIDTIHDDHQRAHRWFDEHGKQGWATCPITENGLVRIVSNPRYTNSPGGSAAVAALVSGFRSASNHEFWPDDISLIDHSGIDLSRLLGPAQITDTYLLVLAVAHGSKFATFYSRLVTDAVIGGRHALHLIR